MNDTNFYTLNLSEGGFSIKIYRGLSQHIDSAIAEIAVSQQDNTANSVRREALADRMVHLIRVKQDGITTIYHPQWYTMELVWDRHNKCKNKREQFSSYRIHHCKYSSDDTFSDLTWQHTMLAEIVRRVSQSVEKEHWVECSGNHGHLHAFEGVKNLLKIVPELDISPAMKHIYNDGLPVSVADDNHGSSKDILVALGVKV